MHIETWADLGAAIAAMTPEQQQQRLQGVKPCPDETVVQELMPAIAVATVGELGFYKCRSSVDNKYHSDEMVLLLDSNPFAADGALSYRLDRAGFVAETDYGKDGKTHPDWQCSPEALNAKQGSKDAIPEHVAATILRRSQDIEKKRQE